MGPLAHLPLRSHVDEMKRRVHPAVEDKVRVGGQVATGKKQPGVKVLIEDSLQE